MKDGKEYSERKKMIEKNPELVREVSGTDVSAVLKEDFRSFLWVTFKTMGIEPHDIQYEAAHWLQTSSTRIVFSCMREFGKTIILASYVCWELDRDPNHLFVIQCATQDKAVTIVSLILQLLDETPYLNHLAPIKGQDTRSALRFNCRKKTSVTRENSVTAYGSASEITGAHVHTIIADDLETRENSLTDLRRERIRELVREYEDLLISDIPTCRVIVVGTPQTQESIYFALAKEGYEMFRLPSRYPSLDNEHLDTLAPFLLKRLLDKDDKAAKPGEPTYPERKPEEYLVKKQFLQGDPRFFLQDLLDPSLQDADTYPLKLRNLIVYDSDLDEFPAKLYWSNQEVHRLPLDNPGFTGDGFYEPSQVSQNYVPFTQRIMWVDPSGSGKDEVSWAVGFGIPGWIYVPEVGGSVEAFDPLTYRKIALTALKYKVRVVLVEPNYGGGAYRKLLEPVFKELKVMAALEDGKWQTTQKEAKILDTCIPLMGAHKIVISRSVAEDKIWGNQLTHLNYTKGSLPHDDRVEAFWGVVNELSDYVEQQDLEQSIDFDIKRREEAAREYWGDLWPDESHTEFGYGIDALGGY